MFANSFRSVQTCYLPLDHKRGVVAVVCWGCAASGDGLCTWSVKNFWH